MLVRHPSRLVCRSSPGNSHEPSPLLKQLRDEGKIGFKTGEGFQKWTPEQVAQSNAELNEYLIRMLYGK